MLIPPQEKLLKLLKLAGADSEDLCSEIRRVSKSCQICQEYLKPPPRPVVGLPMATTFNECVAMDLKWFGNVHLLHLIDHATRLSACAVIRSKKPEVIIREVFRIWIGIYGCPEKFLSDNGGEFSNDAFRELCEKTNITVKTTGAEAPWSNGLCERHNRVLGEMLTKTIEDTRCNLDIAVAWCINAKNSLQNVHGYSPFQLVFGRNPRVPGLLTDRPPALDSDTSAEIVRANLNALHIARRAFIASDSSEKIRRALRHNVRSSGDVKYFSGDKVYYKRLLTKKWKGPAVVLGQDGQQVLVKHGGIYVRVHPCRLRLARERPPDPAIPKSDNQRGQGATAVDDLSTDVSDLECSDSEVGPTDTDSEPSADPIAPVPAPVRPGIPSKNNVNQNVTSSRLRKNMWVQFRMPDDGSWIKSKLISRSGKCSGKYRNEWNTEGSDGERKVIDFDRDVMEWREMPADANENVDVEVLPDGADGQMIGSGVNDMPMGSQTEIAETFHVEELQDTQEAKLKELKSWRQNDVYEEVDDEGQYCVSVRWVITPKIIDGKLQTKARLCARGFEETSSFRTDSPTCKRESVRIALSIIATCRWTIHSIDYKTAFLQGSGIDRTLYLRPPPECKTTKIWRLKKTVYGLADAPRAWFLRLRDELVKLGAKVSSYDKGIFYWHSKYGLEGIVVCFVDDQIWGGTKSFEVSVVEKLRHIFQVGCEHSSAFKYIGIDLVQQRDFSIVINQDSYVKSVDPIVMDRSRQLQKDGIITDQERTKLRRLIGQLNWITGISRPDIGFGVCQLSSEFKRATVKHLLMANKILKYVKSTPSSIWFKPFSGTQDLRVVVFSDASFANLLDGGSQGGQIIFLADASNISCPIAWKSNRTKRVVKSAMAAETLSFVEGCDTGILMANIVSEIVTGEKDLCIPVHGMVDNKSLFEAAHTTKVISDTRLRVEMSILREMIEKKEITVTWIHGEDQLADVLTKTGSSSVPLLKILENGHL